jgi:hypothetical protein
MFVELEVDVQGRWLIARTNFLVEVYSGMLLGLLPI